MNNENFNTTMYIVPGNEPLDRQPKYFKENHNYEYSVYGRSIDKITLLHNRDDVVVGRFNNLKNCKSITTQYDWGHPYLHVHAEHMSHNEPMWKPVHGAVRSLFAKGCYQYKVRGNEPLEMMSERSTEILERRNVQIFLRILSQAKLNEVEIAYDVYEHDINFEALKECPEMSDELFPGEIFYSPIREARTGSGIRLKNKSILAIYDRTKALVDKGKLPQSELQKTHVWRIELRLTSRYIERQIDPTRSVYNMGSDRFMPDFLRLNPLEDVDALAGFSKRTINRYVPIEEVWKDLNPEAELFTLLFGTVGRTDRFAPKSLL